MISAKVIAHSTYEGADKGDELITVEVEFHRWILAEINTHRVLSRNYQSSRAVPVPKLIEQVRNDPAMPVHWGKNQRGMVAEEELNEEVFLEVATCLDPDGSHFFMSDMYSRDLAWKFAAFQAAQFAEAFHNEGYHKQIVNRLLEPFMWTRGVITATRGAWESVFALRCHPDSQPEFQALAYKIREVVEASIPRTLKIGEWHLPFVNKTDNGLYYTGDIWPVSTLTLQEAIKVSTSCCSQVSYRQLDDSLEKALKIYEMLNLPEGGKFKEAPAHMSPCEHQARVESLSDFEDVGDLNGNFGTIHCNHWQQYRKILENGLEQELTK